MHNFCEGPEKGPQSFKRNFDVFEKSFSFYKNLRYSI